MAWSSRRTGLAAGGGSGKGGVGDRDGLLVTDYRERVKSAERWAHDEAGTTANVGGVRCVVAVVRERARTAAAKAAAWTRLTPPQGPDATEGTTGLACGENPVGGIEGGAGVAVSGAVALAVISQAAAEGARALEFSAAREEIGAAGKHGDI